MDKKLKEKYKLTGDGVEIRFEVTPQTRRHPSPLISGISEIFDFGTYITVGKDYYSAEYLDFHHCFIIEILDREKDYVIERACL